MKHSRLIKYIGIPIAAIALSVGSFFYGRSESKIERWDVNGDGLTDIIIPNLRNHRDNICLINKGKNKGENNGYDKCMMVMSNGIPFYATENGERVYSPWGNVFHDMDLNH